MRKIAPSELIINDDGSIFHLHLKPEQVADVVILVGDPARVERVAQHFQQAECRVENREFVTVTGTYRGVRMSVISTGIGTDNIDIVVNELDALVNIDFQTRCVKNEKKRLTLLRLGTCGAIQPDLKVGDFVLSHFSIGFDGLLNFYAGRDAVCDLDREAAFVQAVGWRKELTAPYFVAGSQRLVELLQRETTAGMTVSAPGFYGPQGRHLRLEPADTHLNEKIEQFEYQGLRITNFEMEGSALAGLARLLGHDAITLCTVIAQRIQGSMQTDYNPFVDKMIKMSLEKLTKLFEK